MALRVWRISTADRLKASVIADAVVPQAEVAAHWGVSYGQLESIALGEEASPASTSKPVSWQAEAK